MTWITAFTPFSFILHTPPLLLSGALGASHGPWCRYEAEIEGSQQECQVGLETPRQSVRAWVGWGWGNSNTRGWESEQQGVKELVVLARHDRQGEIARRMWFRARCLPCTGSSLHVPNPGPSLGLIGTGWEVAAPGSGGCVGGNYRQASGSDPTPPPAPIHRQWTLWLLPLSARSPLPSPFLGLTFTLWFQRSHMSWTGLNFNICA